MDKEFARKFAIEWVDAWNRHDLDAILACYADNFEMISPVISRLTDEAIGTLKGKEAVREYWSKALELNPDLEFELLSLLVGVNSIVLNYQGHWGLSAQVLFFDDEGKVRKAIANYE